MAQATPAKPPRPISKGQVAAIIRAIRGRNVECSLSGLQSFDSVDLHNIEELFIESVIAVNSQIERGVSS